jgi:signal peptidase I
MEKRRIKITKQSIKKKTFFYVKAFLILTLIISSYFLGSFYGNKINKIITLNTNIDNNNIDFPNQCYTTLQANNYIGLLPNTLVTKVESEDNNGYLKVDYLNNRKINIFKASMTGSMRPAIPDNSILLTITPLRPEELQVGDIIAVRTSDNKARVLHRIIEIKEDKNNINNTIFITKGDNNPDNDLKAFNYSFTYNNIFGKLIGVLY